MGSMVVLIALALSGLFQSTIEHAFTLAQNRDWAGAAAALDQAASEDPTVYQINNFAYLRGRIAENMKDWPRARAEFLKVTPDSPLRSLAAWHAAVAAARMQDMAAAASLVAEFPPDFPEDLKMQLAKLLPAESSMKIYSTMSTREAKLERARLRDDKAALWSLIRERKDDDIGLQAAHLVAPTLAGAAPRELMEIADTFTAHRQFDYAFPLYQEASLDSSTAAGSRYQLARIQFLREDFHAALETYASLAKDFTGTDWEKDAEYQIASCYWRLGDYKSAEQAYLKYITKYGTSEDAAIRNLVDVYRALEENQKALSWIDKALARRLPISSRQALIFTKAKILYIQKRYSASAALFRQLGRSTIRSSPGGTSKDEVRFFEAQALSKTDNRAAANVIWQDLAASDPFSYYGAKAAERLGRTNNVTARSQSCEAKPDTVLPSIQNNLITARRPLLTGTSAASSNAVTELMFLGLWDEASTWNERSRGRPDYRLAAELAYAAGRYYRAIAYADHLPKSDAIASAVRYPTGFHELICKEAAKQSVDPLWLHAIIWQESKYNPNARSGASARGLMQFIPETANAVGAAIGVSEFSLDKLYDPAVNIPMGAHYWASLLKEFNDPVLALAAYNGGANNVRRWLSKAPSTEKDLFVADIGFVETKKYVQAVYGARAAYGSLK